MRKYFLPLIILLAIVATYGYYEYNRPVKSISNTAADLKSSSNELLAAFESNETMANAIYLDKIVEVTGKVASTEKTNGKAQVVLETTNPMSGIICEMEKNQDISNIKLGNQVSIKGKCTGYLADVILNQAVLISK